VYGDVFHYGQARAVAGPVDQVADLIVRSFEDGLHPAVGEVPYPSGYAVLLGKPPATVPEEHPLDEAGDHHPIADHKQTLPTVRQLSAPADPVAADHGKLAFLTGAEFLNSLIAPRNDE
jgi:hypothetical protein